MNTEQKAAYVIAMSACVIATVAAMQATNQSQAALGLPPRYVEHEFLAVIDEYGIHHNAVLTMFRS